MRWARRGNTSCDKRRNKAASQVHGMDKAQPAMRTFHGRDEVVRVGVLVPLAEGSDCKCHREQREGWQPDAQGVRQDL